MRATSRKATPRRRSSERQATSEDGMTPGGIERLLCSPPPAIGSFGITIATSSTGWRREEEPSGGGGMSRDWLARCGWRAEGTATGLSVPIPSTTGCADAPSAISASCSSASPRTGSTPSMESMFTPPSPSAIWLLVICCAGMVCPCIVWPCIVCAGILPLPLAAMRA